MKSGRRRKSDVVRVRAVYRDVDHTPVPEPPLEPSLSIGTSPGRKQDYWFVDAADPMSLEEAECINRVLAREYCGDPHAVDLPRVLRLAGSVHLKRSAYRVRIIGGNQRRYTRQALVAAFPRPSSLAKPFVNTPHPTCGDRYIAAAVRGVLRDLSFAVEGSRNDMLNRSAFRFGQLGLLYDDAVALLAPVARAIGLDMPEIAATIKSGWHAGASDAGRAAK